MKFSLSWFSRKLGAAYWWVMHRTFKRFNVLKIRSLPPGYYDKDEIMLHACFQLLVNYVEREKPFEWWSPGEDPQQDPVLGQIESLYKWWTSERPKRYVDGRSNGDGGDIIAECENSVVLENKWEEEDQEKLLVLVRLRAHLWT